MSSKTEAELEQIRSAIRDLHYNLDCRQNIPTALCKAVEKIEQILDMPWQQDQELERRKRSQSATKEQADGQ